MSLNLINIDELDADDEPRSAERVNLKISASPFVWRDPASIPRRQWLYGRHLVRGFLSAMVAPGGLGKSSLSVVEAIAIASGKALLGERTQGPLRVWYINLEDPNEEIERRVIASCMHHKVAASDLAGRLFIDGRNLSITLATDSRQGATIDEQAFAAIEATIKQHGIDVLIFDPFASLHELSENDNSRINALCKRLSKLAEAGNCAIELVHHSRKPGTNGASKDRGVDDARGASALMAAVRSMRVLNVMANGEALSCGVERPRSFFRVDRGKSNLAPPPEDTVWREIVEVHLFNGEGGSAGDGVGVVRSYAWPNAFDDVSTADLRSVQAKIRGGEWRADPQSKDWAGRVVADVLELDITDAAAKAKVKSLLKTWLKTGVLKELRGQDAKRTERKFIEVGDAVE